MKQSKKIIITFGVIIIAVLGWWIFTPNEQTNSYLTTKVQKGELKWSVDAVGTVFAANLVEVGTRASGEIKELYVKVGDNVKKGDKIAKIDNEIQQNNLLQKESELSSLKAQLNSAKIAYNISITQYERENALHQKGASSKESLENAKNTKFQNDAKVKELEAKIAQSELSIRTAKQDLSYTDIVAPLDGTVVSVPVEIGQTLNAAQSAPTIVQVADLDSMEIKMEISEADINNIKLGADVEYSVLSNANKKFNGKISSLDPGLTTLSDGTYSKSSSNSNVAVYYYAKMLVDNKQRFLRIGMTTQNKITISDIKNALYLPTTAIKSDENGNFVLIKNEQNVEKKYIKTGINTGTNTQIIEGLNEGQIIVTSSMSNAQLQKMIDDKQIRIR